MIYRFAGLELDEDRYTLLRGSEPVYLPPKSFDLLCHLVRNAGRVVSKDELLRRFWTGEAVSESVLPVQIRTIRRALGAEIADHVIQTVRGLGYRLGCPAEQSEGGPAPALAPLGFVGRESLIHELLGDLQEAEAGASRTRILHGPTGCGKTRLLAELAALAASRGARILHRAVSWTDAGRPLGALLSLLAQEHESERAGERPASLDAIARVLASAGEEPASDATLFRVASACIEHVRQLCASSAVLFLIDDLHRADTESLQALALVLRRLQDQRMLWIGSCDESEGLAGSVLLERLGPLVTEPGMRHTALRGLDERATARLVSEVLGPAAPAELSTALFARTEGSPLFLLDFLDELRARAGTSVSLDAAPLPLPAAAAARITPRLDALGAECRDVLGWAAVIGRVFASPLLLQVCAMAPGQVFAQLARACDAGLLSTDPRTAGRTLGNGEYGFAHALIQETVHARLAPHERTLRHRAVGAALAASAGDHPEGSLLGELADHFFLAVTPETVDEATDHVLRAAHAARASRASATAVRHLEQARQIEELRDPPDPVRRCSVRIALGRALRSAGRRAAARVALLEAADLARAAQRPDLLGLCMLALGSWPRFTRVYVGAAVDRMRPTVMSGVADALGALDPEQHALRAQLEALRARCLATEPHQLSAAIPLAGTALTLARRCGNPQAVFDALLARRTTLQRPDQMDQGAAVAAELLEVARVLGSPPLEFAALEAAIVPQLSLGNIAQVDSAIAAAARIAELLGGTTYAYALARIRLGRELGDAALERAKPLLDQVLAHSREVGDWPARFAYGIAQIWIQSMEGKPSVSQKVELIAEAIHPLGVVGAAMAAHSYFSIGDRKLSAEWFARAAENGFEDLERNDSWLWELCTCADVCHRLRDARRAEQLYAMLEPHAALNVVNSLYMYRGSAHHTLGRLSSAMGRMRMAVQHFEEAIAFNRKIGAVSSLVLSQYHCGRALLRGGPEERERGKQRIREAAKTANEVRMIGLLRRSDWGQLM